MAGMLPGVECARRRRFHQSGGCPDSPTTSSHGSTRRPSFCLYASSSISSTEQRSPASLAHCNEKLADAAREAKERLDERLRVKRKSESKRAFSGQHGSINLQNGSVEPRELHSTEIFGLKKSGPKRFSWAKFSGKSAYQQEECAVCLDQFKEGENLMQLSCAHRFHSRCLVPWLENNPQCPCCRMEF